MGFTFDAPISASYTAADKAHKRKPRGIPLPSKPKRRSLSSSLANIRNSLGHSISLTSPSSASSSSNQKSVCAARPAANSQLFRLPLPIRQQIYSDVFGRDEVFHVLLKRKPSKGYYLGHRKCRANGHRDDCVIANCKQFCDVVNGVYFGYFGSCSGLLRACQDIYQEASLVLYAGRTFDFDHPLSLLLFTSQISPGSLQRITSISLDLGKYLYDVKSRICCKSFQPPQWGECWEGVAKMEGLEELRVRFRNPIEGWMGWSEGEVLLPLWKIKTPLKVFEVEANTDVKQAFDDEEVDDAPFNLVRDVHFPRG